MRITYIATATPTATGLTPTQITPKHIKCRIANGMQRAHSTFWRPPSLPSIHSSRVDVSNHWTICIIQLSDRSRVGEFERSGVTAGVATSGFSTGLAVVEACASSGLSLGSSSADPSLIRAWSGLAAVPPVFRIGPESPQASLNR
jgi:hypothetical protein